MNNQEDNRHKKNARRVIEKKYLRMFRVMRAIVDNNPLLSVDVYDDHVDIEIIEMDEAPTQSRIR